MLAAVLKEFGSPLEICDMPDPVAGAGEIVVDVVAASVLAYAAEVFSGERTYNLRTPVIPGCGAVGRVRQLGAGLTRLNIGDWVFCDPTVRSRDGGSDPDICLQGWDARGDGGSRLQQHYLHGPFGEQMMLPAENAIPLGPEAAIDPGRWCALLTLSIPYGGLAAIELQPGETLLVNGGTGFFGSAAIAVALGMGAGSVIATGRSEAKLADLVKRFGSRVKTVCVSGDPESDQVAMHRAAGGPIDCVLDFLPPSAGAEAVRAAVMTVRTGGRVVLMGGVGLEGGSDLALPYPWFMINNVSVRGQWMYAAGAPARVAAMVKAGLIDLGQFTVSEFPLVQVHQAVTHAAGHAGPFEMTVVRP